MTDDYLPLELWGGVECTINRVGDTFFDQLDQSGHRVRYESDLELFAGLGLRTMRVAIHWEHFESRQSWKAFDLLINTMNRLGIRPIAGLLHHGSGPSFTNLLDPKFPQSLADFALKVATRYPEIVDYTPVNEPHTTARFSCLYGHWYPHHRNIESYLRALFNQVRGIVLAMQDIRTVQPAARLIHTEDGGATFSAKSVEAYRVEREHRRWLGADLLTGAVTHEHPLYSYLLLNGLSDEQILWFTDNRCPPSILGLNYYVTSDRYLDDRLQLYPAHFAGGDSGTEPFVDIEALRVRTEGLSGVRAILEEGWNRYHIPVAITEAHLGSNCTDQVLWLSQVWAEAEAARSAGVDVRAVTAWALLGSYNWCHLCTQDTGSYEPGVYRLSNGVPEETQLTQLINRLATGQSLLPEPTTAKGWWEVPSRLTYLPSE